MSTLITDRIEIADLFTRFARRNCAPWSPTTASLNTGASTAHANTTASTTSAAKSSSPR
ncbi:hypothetical protein ACGFNU_32335 [Spirillospora sp. NPDC048911]|uniref:hypothetical protein n=1 Tax=Spirillospora sp. NPDC048911 TaxID=3364527 RepID=UPI003712CBA1